MAESIDFLTDGLEREYARAKLWLDCLHHHLANDPLKAVAGMFHENLDEAVREMYAAGFGLKEIHALYSCDHYECKQGENDDH